MKACLDEQALSMSVPNVGHSSHIQKYGVTRSVLSQDLTKAIMRTFHDACSWVDDVKEMFARTDTR